MTFICCVSCDSVQLQFCRPPVSTGYWPVAADFFDHYQYPVSGLGHSEEGVCSCGFDHPRSQYSSLTGHGSHRWTGTVVDGSWHPSDLWLQAADAANHSSTRNYFSALISDRCCPSLVKHRAQFFGDLPAFQHSCRCCSPIAPGLSKTFRAWYLACLHVLMLTATLLSSESFLLLSFHCRHRSYNWCKLEFFWISVHLMCWCGTPWYSLNIK